MGLLERFLSIFRAKAHSVADRFEDPNEMLNYSFEKQHELINKLRQDITTVVTSKKRLEIQKAKLSTNISTLEQQARRSLESNREDLARLALERKNLLLTQIKELERQIGDIEKEQNKLEDAERRLSSKIEEFKTRKEMIKAQYSAAEEMNDLGMVLNRVEEKTENMKAKAQALDEMIDSGTLTDITTSYPVGENLDIEKELDKVSIDRSVEEELTKLKTEVGKT